MESIGQTVVVPVMDSSQVAVARRTAREQGVRVGLPEARCDQVEIAAVELATNLLHHAAGGTLLINPFVHARTLELLAVDSGPGMADMSLCLADGYSSALTPGLGLGSIQRLADGMEAYSWPGKGTVIGLRFSGAGRPASLPGVICTALKGEEVSGDRWACKREGEEEHFLVVDGLGHGLQASEAATLAVEIFAGAAGRTPAALVEQMHGPMHSTRGAALAVLSASRETHRVTFCGVGNISGALHRPGKVVHLISQNGTVGHQMRQVRSFDYPFIEGDLLVMHTDGISTHWSLDTYPGLMGAHASSVAAVLHRDFNRGRDDATVLAVRL